MELYTLRVDRAHSKELNERLAKESSICMGWGGGEASGLDAFSDSYAADFRKAYPGVSSRLMNNIGNSLRKLAEDDLLLIPNLPENGKLTVGVVDKNPYSHVKDDATHLNHRIRLKQVFGLSGNIDMRTAVLTPWYAKLRNMRLPFFPNYRFGQEAETLLAELRKNPGREFKPSTLDEFCYGVFAAAWRLVGKKLGEMHPSNSEVNFEAVCEKILASHGYKITGRHLHDGKGGDVDIACVKSRRDVSPFEDGETVLLVQVKKHEGETDAEAVRQLLPYLADPRYEGAFGCVMSLGETFSEEARELAGKQNIALIARESICQLLIGLMPDENGLE